MSASTVPDTLGYATSPNFLTGDDLRNARENGRSFRRAQDNLGLEGVYVLRAPRESESPDVPVVYVCRAASEDDARQIHRKVWNQDIVPFLIVHTDTKVRLYSGFNYSKSKPAAAGSGLLREGHLQDVGQVLAAFKAHAVDDGTLWREWGAKVTPERRVDWRLLDNLKQLEGWLRSNGLRERPLAHALIGKYVYLHYLRARGILSDRKLAEWGIERRDVFGRDATLRAFRELVDWLDEWLNGAVFPISRSELASIRAEHLKRVSGAFAGDTMDGQLHLDFDAYDFSYIPIETISVIYEQFLHAPKDDTDSSVGRERGAYYTPVPLVSFILSELNRRRPLRPGMRVLDASCGSGAFLVQCYRNLIEQRVRDEGGRRPRPAELRDLLVKHIFGVDNDGDACQVAELSLILTLLDYVEPPDLSSTTFQLPRLRDHNILHGDAFDDKASWVTRVHRWPFHWIVGNPPWKDLKPRALAEEDRLAWEWTLENRDRFPTGGNQLAEAFAWRVRGFAAPDGVIGLLLPAMTLFKYESKAFRQAFFRRNAVCHVANFANLAEVLFAGRSRVPAAALFYTPLDDNESDSMLPPTVTVYSPLVANQEATRPATARRRQESWNIVINASEVRDIPYHEVVTGDFLPWKTATWGSTRDVRLLRGIDRQRFPSLGELEGGGRLWISEGIQLRRKPSGRQSEPVEHHPELQGRPRMNISALKHRGRLFNLPEEALEPIPEEETYVRGGRFDRPHAVCQPPHIIISAARNFAIFSDEFIVVPPRQIGIAGASDVSMLLKAIALYLNSDFAQYHQFLRSPQFGVQRGLATLQALRQLPVPIGGASDPGLNTWCELYDSLALASGELGPAVSQRADADLSRLLRLTNDLVYDALRLDARQRALVDDLVNVRMALNDGKVGLAAVRPPSDSEIREYGGVLKNELDDFVSGGNPIHHVIDIWYSDGFGITRVGIANADGSGDSLHVRRVGEGLSRDVRGIVQQLRSRHSQWVYFDRRLTVYEEGNAYLFKPMQRVHWTRSQAMIDAGEVIAETLTPAGA
jgi:hypothetical protein